MLLTEPEDKPEAGILELTKTILGDITEEEAEGALTFVITTKVTEGGEEVTKYLKADGTLSDTEIKLTLKDFEHDKGTDKYTLTITTSELGSYTVTETTKDIDGKDVTVTHSVDGGEKTEGTETEAAVEDGKTTRVEFQNNYEKTFNKKVLRVEPTTQEALPGAVIQLLDEEGNVLREWISSDQAPEILEGLKS